MAFREQVNLVADNWQTISVWMNSNSHMNPGESPDPFARADYGFPCFGLYFLFLIFASNNTDSEFRLPNCDEFRKLKGDHQAGSVR